MAGQGRRPPVEAWLGDWFARRAPEVRLAPADNYFDQGVIDSFDAIELIEAIETSFAVRFTEHDFQDRRFATLAGLAEIIRAKGGS